MGSKISKVAVQKADNLLRMKGFRAEKKALMDLSEKIGLALG